MNINSYIYLYGIHFSFNLFNNAKKRKGEYIIKNSNSLEKSNNKKYSKYRKLIQKSLKVFISLLTIISTQSVYLNAFSTNRYNENTSKSLITSVSAYEFQGNEKETYNRFMKLSSLNQSQKEEYSQFVQYLDSKVESYRKQVETVSANLNNKEQKDVEELQSSIESLEEKIESSEEKIVECQSNISATQQKIEEKEDLLKDRMYDTQEYNNSNSYIDYIFGAKNFSDFLSRVSGINEITEYDRELINELALYKKKISSEKEEIEKQKDSLTSSKNNQKSKLKKLQAFYENQAKEQQQNLTVTTSEYNELCRMQDNLRLHDEKISQAASNVIQVSNKSNTSDNSNKSNNNKESDSKTNNSPSMPNLDNTNNSNSSSNQESNKDNTSNGNSSSCLNNSNNLNNSKPPVKNNGSNNTSNSNNSNNSNSSSDTTNSELNTGTKIVNYALSKLGCSYVWGATGPSTFDCSGLVYWSHRQAGIKIPRYTSYTMNSAGVYVSRSEMKPGDVILFSSTGTSSGIHHVGIYIGNNKMVHAPHTGDVVKITSLSSNYYSNQWYTQRRLY